MEYVTLVLLASLAIAVMLLLRRRAKAQVKVPTLTPKALEEMTPHESPELLEAAASRVFRDQDPEAVRSMLRRFKFTFASTGDFGMKPDQQDLDYLVDKVFAREHADEVRRELLQYGAKSTEPDKFNIWLHVIHLSDGDHTKVPALVKDAKNDFRNTFLASANPNMAKLMRADLASSFLRSDPATRDAIDADLRQIGMWLLMHSTPG